MTQVLPASGDDVVLTDANTRKGVARPNLSTETGEGETQI